MPPWPPGSPHHQGSWPSAPFALDDDWSTLWQADATGQQWLQLDLGQPIRLSKVQQVFAKSDVWHFSIAGSLDGTAWTTLVDRRTGVAGQVFASPTSGRFRYLRTDRGSVRERQASIESIARRRGSDRKRLTRSLAKSAVTPFIQFASAPRTRRRDQRAELVPRPPPAGRCRSR